MDAPLGDAFEYWQGLTDQVRFGSYRRDFSVDPRQWAENCPPDWAFDLAWREYRYADVTTRSDLDRVITEDEPGLYVFYARPQRLVNRFPQFALYVGISNEGQSLRPLRDRLKDYLPTSLSQIRKRENVHLMIQLYYGSLWVAFTLMKDHASEVEELETKLHGYLHPCFARRDFPVGVKRQQKAFGVI